MKTLIIVLMLLFATVAYCADVVQIADIRDANSKWSNWTVQAVTWDTAVVPDIPDGSSTTTKSLQSWYFPMADGWHKATFTRTKLGEYGIRWSADGIIWSDSTPLTILKPGNAQNGK
jgi:hypothetical protein